MSIIRAASEEDLSAILEIYNDAIVNTTSVYHYKPHTLEMRLEWFRDKMKGNFPVIVTEIGGRIAGFATFGPFRPWPAYKYTIEHSVYVHQNFRRQGIASSLLKELIRLAEQHNVHAIVAGIDADNAGSIALHQQLGFSEIGHFKEVGYKFGKWLDLKFLQLILKTPLHPKEG